MSHTASIAPIIFCLPITTSSSRHSSCAVNPGSTSEGSACLRTPNSDSPVSVGTMFFPWATRKACFLSPPIISARVAGVPIPLACFSRSRNTSSSTKRQAFSIASIRVPSLYRGGGRVSLSSMVGFTSFVSRGIQRAEDDLLRTQPQLHDTEMPLAQVGVLAGFSATDLKVIEPYLKRASYPAGAVVFRENEVGNEVLMVIRGTASAYLQTPNTNIRLATFAPGTIFGELAILDEGMRSATVIADKELACRALTTSDFAALSATSPSVAIRLLAAIARELSGRLRTANRTIHQLDT